MAEMAENQNVAILGNKVNRDHVELPVVEEKEKKFRFNSKTILLTYPQCTLEKEVVRDFLKSKFTIKVIIVAQEDHHETDGKHIHVYAEFTKKVDIKNARAFDIDVYHPNIGHDKTNGKKSAKSSKTDMIKYVIKDGNFIAEGIDVKQYLKARKDKRAYISKDLLEGKMTLLGALEEEPKLLFCLSSLQKNLSLYQSIKAQTEYKYNRTCWWIYGKPGIGKSYAVRKLFPNVYVKGNNKWWDGYIDQKEVLIDDLDSDALKHYIKIWADPYKFNGETKGGTILPTYTKLFITSNYTMGELYKEETLCHAISRRFTFINANDLLDENGFCK